MGDVAQAEHGDGAGMRGDGGHPGVCHESPVPPALQCPAAQEQFPQAGGEQGQGYHRPMGKEQLSSGFGVWAHCTVSQLAAPQWEVQMLRNYSLMVHFQPLGCPEQGI